MTKYVIMLLAVIFASIASAKNTANTDQKASIGTVELPFSEETMTYVEANVLATFYHELGHAVIDKLRVPIFAREEDAADYFSIILTEYLLPEDQAELVIWASADQYLQIHHKYDHLEPYYEGVHSLDMVRFYNTICLYYGKDVELRDDFADENGLPEYRRQTCAEEREMAEYAWNDVIAEMENGDTEYDWLIIDEFADSNNEYILASHKVIEDAVKMLNERFSVRSKIRVRLTECNEDNAFYDPDSSKILMCNELIPPLSRRIDGILAPNATR